MKEKKDLKKIFSITGIIALGIYLLFYLITSNVNLFSNISHIGFNFSILSNIWTILKTILIYGFMGYYLIYEMTKKDNKNDKTMNIILFIVFCILVLSSLISIFQTFSILNRSSRYLNGLNIISYVIMIITNFIKIGLSVLFGINIMGCIANKKTPAKVLTFVVFGLIALIFVNTFISLILDLIVRFNFMFVLLSFSSLISIIALSAFEVCLAYVIYDKIKNKK